MRRHLVTKGSFYERLADHGHEIVADSDFAHCYSPDRGRPSIPPSVMMRTVLCATHDRTSDAETSRRTRVDADWKAAMGGDDEFTGIGATTLSLFRARLVLHDAERTVFERTVERAVERGVLRGKVTAIIDSSPVAGAGAVADTYELVRGFIAKLARAAGGLDPDLARRVEPLCGGKPDIDWDDPEARRDHLGELVAVGRALLAAVEGNGDPAVTEPAALLAAVVAQDVEQSPEDPDDPRPRIRRGVAPDRIVSHSDPDMRHGRKSASRRFDGHKLHALTDEASELLGAAAAVGGVEVAPVLADMAYSDGDTRVAVEHAGAEVVAKVPPIRNGGRLPKTEFAIDPEADRDLPGRGHHHRCPTRPGPQGTAGRPVRVPRRDVRGLPPPGALRGGHRSPHRHRRAARGEDGQGPGGPGGPGGQGPAPVAGQGGAQDRPSSAPRHAPGPVQGQAQDQAAGHPRRDRGQLQPDRGARSLRRDPGGGLCGVTEAGSTLAPGHGSLRCSPERAPRPHRGHQIRHVHHPTTPMGRDRHRSKGALSADSPRGASGCEGGRDRFRPRIGADLPIGRDSVEVRAL